MAKPSRKLLENEPDLPGSPEDLDMNAAPESVEPLINPNVSDEDAVIAMTDVMGGSGDARFRSHRILARFALEGWRIVKGN